MSALPSPQSSASADLTRQQLDELDALLQRMLELPVHQLDERPAPTEPTTVVSLSVLEPEPELAGSSETVTLRTDPPSPVVRTAAPVKVVVSTEEANTPPEDFVPPPVWLWPLVWGNEVFDRWADCMGKPGHWLRRPSGRALLGWTGLTCLAAALVLLVYDWIRINL
jgi:hypothetical protein